MTYIATVFSVRFSWALRHIAAPLLVAIALLAACTASAMAACPLQAQKMRVTDSAGVLGARAGALADKLAAYERASGHQIAVLVIPSLDGAMSVEECAVTTFKQWTLGRKGVDDGVLLLVAVNDRKIRIEVGYGLEGSLTDAQSSRIIHEVMGPLFARGEYAEGIDRGLDAIMAVVGAPDGATRAAPKPGSGDDAISETIGMCVATVLGVLALSASTLGGIVGLLAFGTPIIGVVFFPTRTGAAICSLLRTSRLGVGCACG